MKNLFLVLVCLSCIGIALLAREIFFAIYESISDESDYECRDEVLKGEIPIYPDSILISEDKTLKQSLKTSDSILRIYESTASENEIMLFYTDYELLCQFSEYNNRNLCFGAKNRLRHEVMFLQSDRPEITRYSVSISWYCGRTL